MTITRRLGLRYAFMAAACLLLVVWLGWHEFVVEPAAFAARGVSDLRKDTTAETATVCFLALIPVMLGVGCWRFGRRYFR